MTQSASWAVFGFRDFRFLLAARLLTTVAVQVEGVAIGWLVYDISGRALDLGLVGLAAIVPYVTLSLFAGDVADRVERRRILAACHVLDCCGALGLLALALADVRSVEAILAVLAAMSAGRSFRMPATQALLANVIPTEYFPRAVAWTSSGSRVAMVAGGAIGGLLFMIGAPAAFTACACAQALAAFAAFSIRTRFQPEPPVEGFLARVTSGIDFIRRRRVILGAISLDLFAVLLGGATALLPIFARDVLDAGPTGLGILRSAPAFGAGVVALWLAFRPIQRHAGPAMFAGVAVFGAATIVFGLSESFALSVAALAVLGAADMVSVVIRSTVVQIATPDALRGRVSAVNGVFVHLSNDFGEFESGLTAEWWGAVPAVVVGGAGTLAITALWMALFPELRRADRLDRPA